MLRDQRLQDALAAFLERRKSSRFILFNEPAVADHVGGENCGEATLNAFFAHVVPCPHRTQYDEFYGYSTKESIGSDLRSGSEAAVWTPEQQSPVCHRYCCKTILDAP